MLLRVASRLVRFAPHRSQVSALLLGPTVLLQRWSPPSPLTLAPLTDLVPGDSSKPCAAPAPGGSSSRISDWLGGILLMAVPKKRMSYHVKRVRQAGHMRTKGPHVQKHMYLCPVCERHAYSEHEPAAGRSTPASAWTQLILADSGLIVCGLTGRMRVPHRVCEREDCQTYFKHRWY